MEQADVAVEVGEVSALRPNTSMQVALSTCAQASSPGEIATSQSQDNVQVTLGSNLEPESPKRLLMRRVDLHQPHPGSLTDKIVATSRARSKSPMAAIQTHYIAPCGPVDLLHGKANSGRDVLVPLPLPEKSCVKSDVVEIHHVHVSPLRKIKGDLSPQSLPMSSPQSTSPKAPTSPGGNQQLSPMALRLGLGTSWAMPPNISPKGVYSPFAYYTPEQVSSPLREPFVSSDMKSSDRRGEDSSGVASKEKKAKKEKKDQKEHKQKKVKKKRKESKADSQECANAMEFEKPIDAEATPPNPETDFSPRIHGTQSDTIITPAMLRATLERAQLSLAMYQQAGERMTTTLDTPIQASLRQEDMSAEQSGHLIDTAHLLTFGPAFESRGVDTCNVRMAHRVLNDQGAALAAPRGQGQVIEKRQLFTAVDHYRDSVDRKVISVGIPSHPKDAKISVDLSKHRPPLSDIRPLEPSTIHLYTPNVSPPRIVTREVKDHWASPEKPHMYGAFDSPSTTVHTPSSRKTAPEISPPRGRSHSPRMVTWIGSTGPPFPGGSITAAPRSPSTVIGQTVKPILKSQQRASDMANFVKISNFTEFERGILASEDRLDDFTEGLACVKDAFHVLHVGEQRRDSSQRRAAYHGCTERTTTSWSAVVNEITNHKPRILYFGSRPEDPRCYNEVVRTQYYNDMKLNTGVATFKKVHPAKRGRRAHSAR